MTTTKKTNAILIATLVAIYSLLIPALARGDDPPRPALAVVTDDNGGAVEDGREYPLGDIIALSAATSKHGGKDRSITWLVSPPEASAKTKMSPDSLYLYIPTGTEPSEITVTLFVCLADDGDVTVVKLLCGGGPRPPPKPKPKPDDDPKPPAVSRLQVIVIEDVLNRSVDTAKVVNATALWERLREAGHETKFYDRKTNELAGRKYVSEVSDISLPALLIRDADRDRKLEAIALPKTVDGVNQAVGKWVAK
jgi:hypothetical protein